MRQSRRAKRMERHHRRIRRGPGFNLISLMDIFTILVFFLLVNSSDVQEAPSSKAVQLPESIAEQKPRETVIVMVTDEDLLVQGTRVASLAEITRGNVRVIAPLKAALEAQARRVVIKQDDTSGATREVTIMGDREIPFRVLKKVMTTCTQAGYERISLAVLQKSGMEEAES
jgi:biopolymer transport protein TolR